MHAPTNTGAGPATAAASCAVPGPARRPATQASRSEVPSGAAARPNAPERRRVRQGPTGAERCCSGHACARSAVGHVRHAGAGRVVLSKATTAYTAPGRAAARAAACPNTRRFLSGRGTARASRITTVRASGEGRFAWTFESLHERSFQTAPLHPPPRHVRAVGPPTPLEYNLANNSGKKFNDYQLGYSVFCLACRIHGHFGVSA